MNTIKLDSAGIIYPYVKTDARNSEFRIEAELTENIDKAILEKSVSDIKNRFPTFFVMLKKQGSLFVLEKAKKHNVICDEKPCICMPFDFENEIPFRLTVHNNRLSMEVFHVLADGHGAIFFFKTLLARYYALKGIEITPDDEILDINEAPKSEETEDAFLKIYKGGKSAGRIDKFAYQYRADAPRCKLSLTHFKINSDELKAVSKKFNTTIGIFLVSVYLYSFLHTAEINNKKDLKISVPADLRRIFGINTLRNFSLYAIVGIKPDKDKFTLEEIIKSVSKQMQEQLTEENLKNMAYSNVTSQNTKLFEMLPMPVKKAILSFGFDFMGERLFTSAFSNVGLVKFPDGLKEHIVNFKLMLGEAAVNNINTVATTFGNCVNLTFSSRVEDNSLQKAFASTLRNNELTVECSVRNPESLDYIKTDI